MCVDYATLRMTHTELVKQIKTVVAQCATQAEAAEKLGVSAQYLGDVLAKRRAPGPKMLKRLKVRKVVGYEAKK